MKNVDDLLPDPERDVLAAENVPERFAELRASLAKPATYEYFPFRVSDKELRRYRNERCGWLTDPAGLVADV